MENYGFVYIWYDRKYKMYYIGSRWGNINDGYICSSPRMLRAYARRKEDFKRRILKYIYTNKSDLLKEEDRWLQMIDPTKTNCNNRTLKERDKNVRYYNLNLKAWNVWHTNEDSKKTIGEKISASKKGKNTGPRDPSVGKAISAAKKGKPLTEEHKASLRGIKKSSHTEEWKQQNSEKFKQLWSDPEFKAKQTESRKAAWIKRRQNININNKNQVN